MKLANNLVIAQAEFYQFTLLIYQNNQCMD